MITKEGKRKNPSIDSELEEKRILYRQTIKEAYDIISLKGHIGWERLVKNIEEKLEETERKLDNFEKLTSDERSILLKERKDFRWMCHVVDRVEENIPQAESALSETERKIAIRESRTIES